MPIDVDIWGELKGHLGRIESELAATRKRLQEQANSQLAPVLTRIPFSGVMPASGLLTLQPGSNNNGPEQGRFWNVRSICITGSDPSVTVTGRADVYVSAGQVPSPIAALSVLGSADWRDYTTTIPSVAFYGNGELSLRHNENIFIVVSGVAAGTQLAGGITVVDWQEVSAPPIWRL